MLMQFVRKTAVGLVASLLLSLLITFGIVFGLQRVFGSPAAIKQALKASGFYQSVIPNALDQAQKDQKNQGTEQKEEIPLDKPEVRTIVQNAASPDFLQSQTEGVLDSIYAWLQGKTPKLTFAVDLATVKARLSDGVEQYAQQHLASLPRCTGRSMPNQDIDPFNATCLPPGANVDQVAAKAKDQVLNGDFLKDTQLTADSIKTDKEGDKTLADDLKDVPAIYQKTNLAINILGPVLVLLALALVFLSISRRAGLKKLAILAISAGTIGAIIGVVASYALQRASTMATEPLQQTIFKVVQMLVNDLRNWWVGYGLALLLLGAGTLVALHFVGRTAQVEPPERPKTDPSEDANHGEADKETKPKPTKKLIQ